MGGGEKVGEGRAKVRGSGEEVLAAVKVGQGVEGLLLLLEVTPHPWTALRCAVMLSFLLNFLWQTVQG